MEKDFYEINKIIVKNESISRGNFSLPCFKFANEFKEKPENIESPSVLMSIFNIPFSRKLQSSEIFLKSLQYKILILLLQPKYSHRRKPIPYICGLGAKVGCEHV